MAIRHSEPIKDVSYVVSLVQEDQSVLAVSIYFDTQKVIC